MNTGFRRAAAMLGVALALGTCVGEGTAPTPAPIAPTGLTAAAEATRITLVWMNPPGTVDEVRIQRAANGGAFAPLATLKPAAGTYTDTGLSAGTAYGYQVQACNAGGCSAAAAVSTTTPPTSGPMPLAIWNPALPPSLVSHPYTPAMRTTGGSGGSATWSVVSGSLPAGVRLREDGSFSGTPTTAGSYPLTIEATSGGASARKDFSIRIFTPDPTRWNLTRMDVRSVPADIEPAIAQAVARWESIITRDLHTDTIPNGFFPPEQCGGYGRASEGSYVDDMFLIVDIGTLEGGVIGQASVCGYRSDDYTSVIGILTLSSAYLRLLAGTSTLTNVVFHEIGHALGYGVLWEMARVDPASSFDYVTTGTCVYAATGLTVGADPGYTGPGAVKEWNAAGGSGNVPLEDRDGLGTACAHWRESVFRTEVMTGFVEPTGTTMPLSRVTLGSMADLGFTVDMSKADPYVLPAAVSRLQAPSPWTIGGDLLIPRHWERVQNDGRPRPLTHGRRAEQR